MDSLAAGHRPLLPKQIKAMEATWEEWDRQEAAEASLEQDEPVLGVDAPDIAIPEAKSAGDVGRRRTRRQGFTRRVYRFFLSYTEGETGQDQWSMQRLYQLAGLFTVRNGTAALIAATLAMSTREEPILWLCADGVGVWPCHHGCGRIRGSSPS